MSKNDGHLHPRQKMTKQHADDVRTLKRLQEEARGKSIEERNELAKKRRRQEAGRRQKNSIQKTDESKEKSIEERNELAKRSRIQKGARLEDQQKIAIQKADEARALKRLQEEARGKSIEERNELAKKRRRQEAGRRQKNSIQKTDESKEKSIEERNELAKRRRIQKGARLEAQQKIAIQKADEARALKRQQDEDKKPESKILIYLFAILLIIGEIALIYWLYLIFPSPMGIATWLFKAGLVIVGLLFLSLFILPFNNESADDFLGYGLAFLFLIIVGAIFFAAIAVGGVIGMCVLMMLFLGYKFLRYT